ncbi:MAG: hypothetical protein ABWX60_01645 [Aeromicrobium sp.]
MTQPPDFPQPDEGSSTDAPGPYGQPAPPYGTPPYPPRHVNPAYGYAPQQVNPIYGYAPQHTPSGMYQAAAIINWVVLGLLIVGTCGLGIVAAAWFVPMTINIHKGAKDREKHTALGVCTLLFCNLISGILMLVEDSNRPARPML